jgi:ABC-2 type transport system ATP-binding protein
MHSLCPKRTFEVQLADRADCGKCHAFLESMGNGLEDLQSSQAEGVVRFSSQKDEQSLGEILREMIGAGLSVTQFREVPSDLEDAFLSVAKPTGAIA